MKRRRHQHVLVGVDVPSIGDAEQPFRKFGDHHLTRLYTDHEREICREGAHDAASSLAARFAAKETVDKLLDASNEGPSWCSIEIYRAQSDRPELVPRRRATEIARRRGVEDISRSLAHDGYVAAATGVARASLGKRSR